MLDSLKLPAYPPSPTKHKYNIDNDLILPWGKLFILANCNFLPTPPSLQSINTILKLISFYKEEKMKS